MEQKVEKWVWEHAIQTMEMDGKTWWRARDICDAMNFTSTQWFSEKMSKEDIYKEPRGASACGQLWVSSDGILKYLDDYRRMTRPLNRAFRQWIALDKATRPETTPQPATATQPAAAKQSAAATQPAAAKQSAAATQPAAAKRPKIADRRQKFFDDLAKAPKEAPRGLMDDIRQVLDEQGITGEQLLVAALALSGSIKFSGDTAPADL